MAGINALKTNQGILIAFEGIDGTGKSTQIKLLADCLAGLGLEVVCTREPTDGEYGRRIRELYVRRDVVTREEELELFLADRRQHVEQVIKPALACGRIVLTDRYYFSTAAYQGANGLDPAEIMRLNEMFAPRPDLVLLIQLPVDVGLQRITNNRGDIPNSFEQKEYLQRVAAVFDGFSDNFIEKIDGQGSVSDVHERIAKVVLGMVV